MNFFRNESGTDRGEEIEAMRTVVDTNVDVDVFRSLFNTSTISMVLDTFCCVAHCIHYHIFS